MSAYPLRPRRAGVVVLAMVVFLVMISPALAAAADVFGFTPGRSFPALAAITSGTQFLASFLFRMYGARQRILSLQAAATERIPNQAG